MPRRYEEDPRYRDRDREYREDRGRGAGAYGSESGYGSADPYRGQRRGEYGQAEGGRYYGSAGDDGGRGYGIPDRHWSDDDYPPRSRAQGGFEDYGYPGGEGRGDRGRGQVGRSYYGDGDDGYGPSWGGARRGRDDGYRSGHDSGRDRGDDRGWMSRAADEVGSWMGFDEAEDRRREDRRGRGPKGYKRSDSRISEDVNDRLTDDHDVDASEISVSVKDCEVTLAGTVDSRRAKRQAEDCAESVSGVRHVQNNLRVKEAETFQNPKTA